MTRSTHHPSRSRARRASARGRSSHPATALRPLALALSMLAVAPAFATSQFRVQSLGSGAVYPSIDAFVADLKAGAVPFCHAQGWSQCTVTGVSYQDWNGATPGSFPVPVYGYIPNKNTATYIHTQACNGNTCVDDTDQWTVFTVQACPDGQVWKTDANGSMSCVGAADSTSDEPKQRSEERRVGKEC